MQSKLWRERALATTNYCLQSFWDEKARKFRPATPTDPNALPWEFMWGNGVAFSMLVGSGDKERIAAFFEGLQGYWDTNAPISGYDAYLSSPGNSDKYYDDNAWMVLTFVEAYEKPASASICYVLSRRCALCSRAGMRGSAAGSTGARITSQRTPAPTARVRWQH